MKQSGELAIVLHTHMPYVEGGSHWPPSDSAAHLRSPDGFGTWPFGEEWLWEAVATSYLPLLAVLERVPLTLSLTPVLCDQLEAAGAIERCARFLETVRPESHRRDVELLRKEGSDQHADELEHSARHYASAARTLRSLDGGLLRAMGEHAAWTSAATHAVLPLLASDAGIALQLQSGIASHRRRFGRWRGGMWLPECAYAPWLDATLEQAGVKCMCVELTSSWGLGDDRHLAPLVTEAGLILWPLDRQTISLVWSEDGYPSHPAYRSYHALTPHHHRVWANDGSPYRSAAGTRQAAEHARDFVARTRQRVRDGGVCVCALDTELLGHWWHEGVRWLGAVGEEANRQGLALTTLDDALQRHQPAPAASQLPVSSWGEGGDLRTWSGPPVADLAFQARQAELRAVAPGEKPSPRALRELLALQSSDWAFMAYRRTAGDYPRERAAAHAEAFARAITGEIEQPQLRNLAPDLAGWS